MYLAHFELKDNQLETLTSMQTVNSYTLGQHRGAARGDLGPRTVCWTRWTQLVYGTWITDFSSMDVVLETERGE